ncbi:MAG: hypothetical protein Fur0042_29250 [Cyanophyceae cyanobacterium]
MLLAWSLVALLGVAGCADRSVALEPEVQGRLAGVKGTGGRSSPLEEVAPPEVLQRLGQTLAVHRPQVTIGQPKPEQTLQDNRVAVQIQVKDLPIFKDADLGLGPHVRVLLDDRPVAEIYDLSEPLILENLEPGTHTLRAFAARPWHESFKNDGAFAQVTFHVYAANGRNQPDRDRPLLTYSEPEGNYGAEPLLLDFYLTNAPLHWLARERDDDDIEDWRVRVTVNGSSFVLDSWQPIYLKGFQPGTSWVELELLGDGGAPIDNVYNHPIRTIAYRPGGQDALSRLLRGEMPLVEALAMVDPDYVPPQPEPEPEPVTEAEEPQPEPEPLPASEAEEPQSAPELNLEDSAPASTFEPASELEPEAEESQPEPTSEPEVPDLEDPTPEPASEPAPAVEEAQNPLPGEPELEASPGGELPAEPVDLGTSEAEAPVTEAVPVPDGGETEGAGTVSGPEAGEAALAEPSEEVSDDGAEELVPAAEPDAEPEAISDPEPEPLSKPDPSPERSPAGAAEAVDSGILDPDAAGAGAALGTVPDAIAVEPVVEPPVESALDTDPETGTEPELETEAKSPFPEATEPMALSTADDEAPEEAAIAPSEKPLLKARKALLTWLEMRINQQQP